MQKLLPLVLLVFFSFCAGAQTHIYYFDGNLKDASDNPALELAELLSCGQTVPGTFAPQMITTSEGTCGTDPQTVFSFNEGGGLSYPNNNFIGGTYTIHMLFKFNSLSGYQRIIDFRNNAIDEGLYTLGDRLNFYPNGNVGTGTFVANTYYLLTLVRDGATNQIKVYVDGQEFGSYQDDVPYYVPTTPTTPIIFFKDNSNCEDQAGSIRYVSLKASTSTAQEVQDTWSGICSIVLPLRLQGVTAKKEGSKVVVDWQTEDEVDVSHFEVERSRDGRSFSSIGRVNARNLTTKNQYTYADLLPLAGTSFYRLKMVDMDGSVKYSSVLKVSSDRSLQFEIFPNPATGTVTLSGLKGQSVIKLLSLDGRLLQQFRVSGESTPLSLEGYKPGIYIIQSEDGHTVHRQKLVLQ